METHIDSGSNNPSVHTSEHSGKHMFTVIFDGGYNKSGGYGSFVIFRDASLLAMELRFELPAAGSGNQAEYLSLLRALEKLSLLVGKGDRVRILGDSKLVINQISGDWAVKHEKIKSLACACLEQLADLDWVAVWWPREHSMQFFQH